MKKTTKKIKTVKEIKPIKVDFGCGPNKRGEDWIGVDMYKMKGVDIVCNLAKDKYPFKDNSVDQIHASHFIEHLTNLNDKWERVHFFNEIYRILKPGGKARLIFPHWCSQRYYGDPTHKEPFSEFGFLYLNKDWRKAQTSHADIEWNKNGYNCDFDTAISYNIRADLIGRNQEYMQMALLTQKEAAQDIDATLTKK